MSDLDDRIHAVRRFNRAYTRRIGVLREGLSGSPFPLTEARVLYELAHRATTTAAELSRDLDVDAGYLSRILRSFEKRGLLRRTRSKTDGRRSHLALTGQGRKAFAPLDARSHEEVRGMLGTLSPAAQARLVEAMHTIETLLGTDEASKPTSASRRSSPASWRDSSNGSTRGASAAGSRR